MKYSEYVFDQIQGHSVIMSAINTNIMFDCNQYIIAAVYESDKMKKKSILLRNKSAKNMFQ